MHVSKRRRVELVGPAGGLVIGETSDVCPSHRVTEAAGGGRMQFSAGSRYAKTKQIAHYYSLLAEHHGWYSIPTYIGTYLYSWKEQSPVRWVIQD